MKSAPPVDLESAESLVEGSCGLNTVNCWFRQPPALLDFLRHACRVCKSAREAKSGAFNNSVLIQQKYHCNTSVFASIFHKLNWSKNKCVMVIFWLNQNYPLNSVKTNWPFISPLLK